MVVGGFSDGYNNFFGCAVRVIIFIIHKTNDFFWRNQKKRAPKKFFL
jgi:hypothetical protein